MHRLQKANAIPFVVALQALAFFVLGFFQTPIPGGSSPVPGAGNEAARSPERLTSLSELPRDLQREQLPIPRLPERKKSDEPPMPTPEDEAPPSPGGEGSKLAALRMEDVPLTGPVAIAISAPMLGLPDSLEGQSLAGNNWLGGSSSGRARRGRSGGTSDMGGGGTGRGIGGAGGGAGGGYCPTPGRIGGRGGGGRVTGSPGRPAGGSAGGSTTGRSGGSGGSKGLPAGKGGRTRGRSGK